MMISVCVHRVCVCVEDDICDDVLHCSDENTHHSTNMMAATIITHHTTFIHS